MSPALQHPIGLLQGVIDPRHVPDAERDRVGVEAPIGERQSLGVALYERQPLREGAPRRALFPNAQHVAIDVDDRHLSQRPAGLRHSEGDVASPPGDVDMREGPAQRGADLGDERVLPRPVQAERHQVVHQVISTCDTPEHVVHEALFFIQANGALAEVRLVARGGHQGFSMKRPKA